MSASDFPFVSPFLELAANPTATNHCAKPITISQNCVVNIIEVLMSLAINLLAIWYIHGRLNDNMLFIKTYTLQCYLFKHTFQLLYFCHVYDYSIV